MEGGFPFQGYDWANRVKLGEGSYGVVYKVKKNSTGEFVAVKEMNMSLFTDQTLVTALKTEIELMKNLQDEHLLRLYDSCYGVKYTYLILDLCDGDLRAKMNKQGGKLPEEQAIVVFAQLIKGFKVLTNLGYIHRDIKPENSLVKGQTYKVSDFGFSCKADINCIKKLDMICGTPLYMSPQLLSEQSYTAKCDIWSLGILLFEIIFGYGPWICRNLQAYKENVTRKPLAFPFNGKLGESTKDFIRKCLVVDEDKRMSWKELFQHPLVAEKDAGPPVVPVQVEKSAAEIMKRIQTSAEKKSINIAEVLRKKNITEMDIRKVFCNAGKFEEVCRDVDPTIPSFEVRVLFESLDKSKDGILGFEEFRAMIIQNDFHDADDIGGRYIRELVDIIKRRNFEANKLFRIYDKDNSGKIDKKEFQGLIREFLPRMPQEAIEKIWAKFDKDKSGTIELKEFLHELIYGVADKEQKTMLTTEKTTRCLTALKAAIRYYGVKQEEIMSLFDKNKDGKINIAEFSDLVIAIDKKLPEDEIKMMFEYLDSDRSGLVSVQELRPILF